MKSEEYPLTDRFTKALTSATEGHAGQFRKGTDIPYISHLIGVAALALEYGATTIASTTSPRAVPLPDEAPSEGW